MSELTLAKIYLISTGGAGTHFLYHCYGRAKLKGNKKNWMQHQRQAKIEDTNFRVIYLYAHPIDILMSFYRRGFLKGLDAVNNLGGDMEEMKKIAGCNLEGYANNGVNVFQFKSHTLGWIDYLKREFIPSLILKYEAIRDHKPLLDRFIGTSAKTFVWQQRQSSYANLPEDLAAKLEHVHKADIEFFNSRPPIEKISWV